MFTRSSYVSPIYEDLQPKYEHKETRESHILLVHIPEGFAREHIGAKVEFDNGRVKVFGERPLGNNRICRFNIGHQVPPTCDINKIRGKVEGGIITITMSKKVISDFSPEDKPQPTEQEIPKPSIQETEPKPEKDHEGTPPQSKPEDHQEEKEAKPTEKETKPEQEKGKDQLENEKGKNGKEPEITKEESMPQIDQKGVPQNATIASDSKLQQEENLEKGENQRVGKDEHKEDIEKTSDSSPVTKTEEKLGGRTTNLEKVENQMVGKDEQKEGTEKTSESEKQPEKAVVDDSSPITKIESKEERKESHAQVAETVTTEKDKENVTHESTRKGIKGMADSASQAVESLRKRFNEEDKQKLIYMGAAVVVVALGVYATYKFRTSRRP